MSALVAATYPEVLGVARRILQDPHDAADAAQEAYIRALRGLRRFRGDAAVTTWLHRIAVRTSLDVLRAKGRRAEVGLPEGPVEPRLAFPASGQAPDPALAPERTEERQQLTRALQSLPERLRLAVILRDVEGLSTAETAELLGISEGAAKVRLHRARRLLRHQLFGDQEHGVRADAG